MLELIIDRANKEPGYSNGSPKDPERSSSKIEVTQYGVNELLGDKSMYTFSRISPNPILLISYTKAGHKRYR